MSEATAYWVTAPGRGELRRERLSAAAPAGSSRVRARYSAVSVGTERLVGLGRVPAALAGKMACQGMAGSFALPVKYGYCMVGTAESGPYAGRGVFAMHPHQDLLDLADAALLPLPAGLPLPRATLIANLETALNAVWDAELSEPELRVATEGGPAIAVFGGGAVGLLLAFALHALHGVRALLVEPSAERRARAAALPFVGTACAPGQVAAGSVAVAFHTSGQPQALQGVLEALAFEGRVLELSWYGDQRVSLDLGGRFHADRLRIIASQVGHVARSQRAAGSGARLREVLRLLSLPQAGALDALLGTPTPFAELPARMAAIYQGVDRDIVPLVAYGRGEAGG